MTKVSIIIPTYNEEKILIDCIESLEKQSFTDFEIIIIDDGSTDGTYKILQEFKIQDSRFKILRAAHAGAGAARNLGAKEAKGEILVFVDADMTFDKSFLENLVAPILSGKSKGTFSKDEFVSNWDNVWARCWNINEGWVEKRRHPKNYPDTQPVFRAIIASEFNKVGGFTPGGYDDDWSLFKKLGYMADAAFNAVFYHKNPSSLSEIFKHAKWVGKRKYKLGFVGYLVALVRSSLPVSLFVGLYKSFCFPLIPFTLFKIVYDFGIFCGIVEYIFTGRASK